MNRILLPDDKPLRFAQEHPYWCAGLILAIALSYVMGEMAGMRIQRHRDFEAMVDGQQVRRTK